MSERASTQDMLLRLRDAGAAQFDAVGWHYVEVLSQRMLTQNGPTQALLQEKLLKLLSEFQDRLAHQTSSPGQPSAPVTGTSPLAALLQEMAPPPTATPTPLSSALGQRSESPRVRQFRQQLRRISVQKQVSKAIAQAPQNAGPINSHMLMLRALGLMQAISPDYLNRFMTHVDTLLCLEEAERQRLVRKTTASKTRKK